jgi:hypothetical protein
VHVRRPSALILLALALTGGANASAQDRQTGECFDTVVSARIIAQVPTVAPEFDDGSIVMRWPWFLDLEVRRTHQGNVPGRKITVLALMHTYWRSNLGYKRWLLRRNDQGTFNLLGLAEDGGLAHCAENAAPAPAYIRSASGERLNSLRLDGEKRYGRHPD